MDVLSGFKKIVRLVGRIIPEQFSRGDFVFSKSIQPMFLEIEKIHGFFISSLDKIDRILGDLEELGKDKPKIQLKLIEKAKNELVKLVSDTRNGKASRTKIYYLAMIRSDGGFDPENLSIVKLLNKRQEKSMREFYKSVQNYFVLGRNYGHRLMYFLSHCLREIDRQVKFPDISKISDQRREIQDEILRMNQNWEKIAKAFAKIRLQFPG